MSSSGKIKSYLVGKKIKYYVEIQHKELDKYQVIRGDSTYIVAQKANAIMARWDEMYRQKLIKERNAREKLALAKDKEQKNNLANEKTAEAEKDIAILQNILNETLNINDEIDWESLKNYEDFSDPKPAPYIIPTEPKIEELKYRQKYGLLDQFSSSRKEKKKKKAMDLFQHDHNLWEKKNELGRQQYESLIQNWHNRKENFEKKQFENNHSIEEKKKNYLNCDSEALNDYFDMVLSNSNYPDYFPRSYELEYNETNKSIVVDFQLPAIDSLPTLKQVKYIKTKDEFSETHLSQTQLNSIYDNLLYQITLRTIHELIESDTVGAIEFVVFNGYVNSIDPATGNNKNSCILSIQAKRDEFLNINLANVDPKACFKSLKGIGSSKLHSITPVAPILKIDREDARFVNAYSVVGELDETINLAAMDWEDFEHLVREVFEQEFSQNGGEVKITRASRDGGIDAVAFDPDPIRGGKIVIQAKRYTNTVGVSAVRDLFGSVINEGATKGILVSTADYGPDAYEFARGKPITLLNGGNLLHLLEKHGHQAKIDLKEAKLIFAEKEKVNK